MKVGRLRKEAVCENCGKLYGQRRSNQKYCTPECRKEGAPFYQNREEKEKTCALCGEYYLTFKKHQKYCSPECTQKVRRAYLEKYRQQKPSNFLRMRFQVLQRDKFRCQYCGRGAKDGVTLVIDHIAPRSKAGTDSLINFVTACEDCNGGKSDVLLTAKQNGQLHTFMSI